MSDDAPINTQLKAGDWFKLSAGDDWGVGYLARDPFDRRPCVIHYHSGDTVTPRNGYSKTSRVGRAYVLRVDETMRVRLLDGTERIGKIAFRSSSRTVGDMGQAYTASSALPFVAFPDGTEVSLSVAEIQYEPERDPTADEVRTNEKAADPSAGSAASASG